MNRAPGSTVLGLVEAGETLIEIEVQTNWAPEEIKELALEEGYEPAGAGSRFQPISKAKPKPTVKLGDVVSLSLVAEAQASVALDRDETHALHDSHVVEAEEVTEDEAVPHGRPEESAGASDDGAEAEPPAAEAASSSLPETDTGAASAPTGAPAELGTAASGAAAPVSPVFVPNAEDLMSAALATGDPDLEQAVVAIEAALTTLAHDLIAYESRSDALAEVRRLEAELEAARIRAGLGPATPSPAATPGKPNLVRGDTTGPTQSEIRAWARSVGMDVNAKGSVRTDVVLAYQAAHQGAA